MVKLVYIPLVGRGWLVVVNLVYILLVGSGLLVVVKLVYIPLVDSGWLVVVKLVYIPSVGGWLEQAHCDGVASVVVVAGDMDEAVEAAVLTDEVAVVCISDGDGDSNNREIPYKMMLHYRVLIIGKINQCYMQHMLYLHAWVHESMVLVTNTALHLYAIMISLN